MRLNQNLIPFLILLFCLNSCQTKTPQQLIVGSWEVIPSGEKANINKIAKELGLPESKVIFTFNSDGKIKKETLSNKVVTQVNSGTYEIRDNGKKLVIYREGMPDRKNESEIKVITPDSMTLIDVSGFNGVMVLKKAD